MANEERLIDANALKVKAFPDPDSGEGLVYVQDIDEAPTVDAVEVVRCKDCIHWCDCKVKLADGTYRDYLPGEAFGDVTIDIGINVCSHCTLHGYEDSSGSWSGQDLMIFAQGEKVEQVAEWKVWENDTPQCTSCGMWMPFARYRRGNGTNARYITNFCPNCGKKMTAMPMCVSCIYGNGKWKDDGICFACREQVWIPGKPHRQDGNEK